MPTQITISNVTGTSPYDIYLSPVDETNYFYMDQIVSSELPYTFIVPPRLQNQKQYCLRIKDGDNCIITNCFSIT